MINESTAAEAILIAALRPVYNARTNALQRAKLAVREAVGMLWLQSIEQHLDLQPGH